MGAKKKRSQAFTCSLMRCSPGECGLLPANVFGLISVGVLDRSAQAVSRWKRFSPEEVDVSRGAAGTMHIAVNRPTQPPLKSPTVFRRVGQIPSEQTGRKTHRPHRRSWVFFATSRSR